MQAKLKEMMLVVRPTQGNGIIPINELESILQQLGYDFLLEKKSEIAAQLDQDGSGCFNQDELIEYLQTNYTQKYTNIQALKEAVKMFDYDNDGKIQFEEFEYFMKNFGESEDFYMDEAKIQLLLECCKPLDSNGNMEIERFIQNINSFWVKIGKTTK